MRILLTLLLLLGGCAPAGDDDDTALDDDDDAGDDDDATGALVEEASGTLQTTNSAGRSGAWFLPEHTQGAPLRLVLLYHPTGGDGASMLAGWTDAARDGGFGLVAPDSRVSPQGQYTWEVGTDPGEVTPDLTHAQDCLDEVLAMGISASDLLAAGHSGGASSAPWIASVDARFTHAAILHGGVFTGGLGANRPPVWLSTGEDDTARPPAELAGHAADLEALGFAVTNTVFPGGHGVSEDERAALLAWWSE